jgi:hypothetical protein
MAARRRPAWSQQGASASARSLAALSGAAGSTHPLTLEQMAYSGVLSRPVHQLTHPPAAQMDEDRHFHLAEKLRDSEGHVEIDLKIAGKSKLKLVVSGKVNIEEVAGVFASLDVLCNALGSGLTASQVTLLVAFLGSLLLTLSTGRQRYPVGSGQVPLPAD